MHWREIRGWLSEAEGMKLQELAHGKEVLEFGCWRGKSAVCMAEVAKHVTTVDHFKGDPHAGRRVKMADAMVTMQELAKASSSIPDKISIFNTTFIYAVRRLRIEAYDFYYYDADHSYEATKAALEILAPLGRPMAFHDYDGKGEPSFAGVQQAVDEAREKWSLDFELVDTLAVLRHPAPF